MARVFSDMSAAGPSTVQWAFMYLLQQLLVAYVCRPHRRGRLHARLRWEDSVGGVDDGSATADYAQLACQIRSCHQMFLTVEVEEENTAGQISSALWLCRHPALSTWSVDEGDGADQNSASWNSRATMFNRLLDYYMYRLRSPAAPSRADLCAWMCRREANDGTIQETPSEGSGDNFDGIACNPPYVEEITASRRRATTNGHRTMPVRLSNNDGELYAWTCPGDRYRLPPGNGQYSTSNQSFLRFWLNIARHELDLGYAHTISIDHGDLWDWDWGLDINDVFSEHRSRRRWQDYSSEEISVQDSHEWTEQPCRRRWHDYSSEEIPMQDDDSHDWKEQPWIVSELHDGSCLDQNSVCPYTDIVDTHYSETLHGPMTTSTALVNCMLPRSADSDTASSSTQLDGRSDDDACSSTAEQPDNSDDMDDCDSMISTITTEELLVREPHSNQEMEVSMAQEQASQTGNGSEGTTSSPWWLIPGFRFSPTGREIVLHYLKRKVLNRRLPAHHTLEEGHNIYALDADEITLDGKYGDKERLGFFFVRRHGYSNGCYYPTPDGYWRIRGRPAGVKHRGRTVASKTAMDFYRGRPPHGCRTPWSMFEYRLNGCHVDLLNLAQPWMNDYVVCKVRRRESKTSGREERWRRPGLLPRRPFLKKISLRRFRPEMIVVPKADVAPVLRSKRKEEDP